MKLGYNGQAGLGWAVGSGYVPPREEIDQEQVRKMVSCQIVNRHGDLLVALYPHDPIYRVEASLARHGLESFTIETLNDPAKAIHHGQLVMLYSAQHLLGVGIIDTLQIEHNILQIKGSGLLKLIYDYRLPEIPSSQTSNQWVANILTLIFHEAWSAVVADYPLIGAVDLLNVPEEILPSFSILEGAKVGEMLEAISSLLGGGAFYGLDDRCCLYFSLPSVSEKLYLHYEALLSHDLKLDIGSVKNQVRVILSDQASGEVITDPELTPYAHDYTSQARYGIRKEEVDMWFLATSQESTISLAQRLIVPDAQWSGKLTLNRMVDLFRPLVMSGRHGAPFREVVVALKEPKDFQLAGDLEIAHQHYRYLLGMGAYDFIGKGSLTLKVGRINLEYLILHGAGQGSLTVTSIFQGIAEHHELVMHDTPNHTSDYRLAITNCDTLILAIDGHFTFDHLASVACVQDISAQPERYTLTMQGDQLTLDIGVGRAQDHQKIFKSLGKQAQLQHQYLLRNSSQKMGKSDKNIALRHASDQPEDSLIIQAYSQEIYTTTLSREDSVYAMHGVLGVYLPYQELIRVEVDGISLQATTYTPISGQYRHHQAAPIVGLLELPRLYEGKHITITARISEAPYLASDWLNTTLSQKQRASITLHDQANLTHPLAMNEIEQAVLKVNQALPLPHEKIFVPARYHIPTKKWQPKLCNETIHIDPSLSALYGDYRNYLGVVLNESVHRMVEVVIEGEVQHPVLKREDLQTYANGYYLVANGEDLESLLLLPSAHANKLVRVQYYGTGSVLSLIDLNQGYQPNWDDLSHEVVLEGEEDLHFVLPDYVKFFAFIYEQVDRPLEASNRVGATSGSKGGDGQPGSSQRGGDGGNGGRGGNGAEGHPSTPVVQLTLGEAATLMIGSVAGYGGIGGGKGGDGGNGSTGITIYRGQAGGAPGNGSNGARGDGNRNIHTRIQSAVYAQKTVRLKEIAIETTNLRHQGSAGSTGKNGSMGQNGMSGNENASSRGGNGGQGGAGGAGGKGGYGEPFTHEKEDDLPLASVVQDNQNPFNVAQEARYRKLTIRWV